MLQAYRARRDDEGFTLIELMVVVLIIAILIAIAIPTFLGARERAQDRGAQSNLRNALTAAKTIFADDGDYSNATVANLLLVEPSLTFQAADSTDMREVEILVSTTNTTDDTFEAVARADSGVCFYIRDISASGTTFGSTDPAPVAGCDVATAPTTAYANEW